MKEIHNNLYIGDDGACASCTRNSNFCIVHACKSCHKKALNYASSLPNTHPNYLTYENGEHLFLNIVDMYDELLPQFIRPIVKETLSFIESRIQHKKVLIHCNFGSSRSPSLGFIYLAHKGIIPNNSYESALQAFLKLYPKYMPGAGITLYMQHDWNWICEA